MDKWLMNERLKDLPCNCRPSRTPKEIDALFPQTHEPDCSYRMGREAFDKIERLQEALENTVKAWEALPGPQRYSAQQIQAWLNQHMSPAIDNARAIRKELIDGT